MSNNGTHYAIILAAGNSSRMGMPKWKLALPGGDTFLGYIARRYLEAGILPVAVVSQGSANAVRNDCMAEGLITVENPLPEKGRMYSLQCGLQAVHAPACCFIHNVDNPFFSGPVISAMLAHLKDYDYVIPEIAGRGGHPVLLSSSLLIEILKCKHPLPVLRDYLKGFNGLRWPVSEHGILLNINTPGAYHEFLAGQG
ncbi:MAG: nucleotidyltransferase family protein [Bacteroidota bacterium]